MKTSLKILVGCLVTSLAAYGVSYIPIGGGGGSSNPNLPVGAAGLNPIMVSSLLQPGGIVILGDSLCVQFAVNDPRFPSGFQTGNTSYGGNANVYSQNMGWYYNDGLTMLTVPSLTATNESWIVDFVNLVKSWTGVTVPLNNSLCVSGGPFYNFGDPDVSPAFWEGYQLWNYPPGLYNASGSNHVYCIAGMTNRFIFWGTNDYGTTNDLWVNIGGTIYNNPSPGNTSTNIIFCPGTLGNGVDVWIGGKPGSMISVRNYPYRMAGSWGAGGSGRNNYPPYYQGNYANDPLIQLTNLSPKVTGIPKALLLFGSQNDRYMLAMRIGTNDSYAFNNIVYTNASIVYYNTYLNLISIGRSLGYWPIIGASIPRAPTVNTAYLRAQNAVLNNVLKNPTIQGALDGFYDWASSNSVYEANGSYHIDGTHPTALLARIEATNFALAMKVNQGLNIGAGNNPIYYDYSYKQSTPNYFPVFNSPDWEENNMNTLAYYDSTVTAWVLNPAQVPIVTYNHQFAIPPGVTTVVVNFSAKSLGNNINLSYGIDNNGSWNPQFNPTIFNTWTNIGVTNSVAFSTVNTNVGFKLLIGSAERMYISNLSVAFLPPPTDPVLSQQFKRYTVFPRNVWSDAGSIINNQNDKTYASTYPYSSALRGSGHSYVEFITDATQVTLDMQTVGNSYLGQNPPFNNTVMVNGIVVTNFGAGDTFGSMRCVIKNVPLGDAGNKIVRIYSTFLGRDRQANTVRGIYVPAANSLSFTKTAANRRVLVLGDSIMMESVATFDVSQDIWGLVGSYLPITTYNLSSGGQSVSNIVANAVKNAALYTAVSEVQPSDIYIQLGLNDSGLYNDTNYFAIKYAELIDTLHAYAPFATIYAQNIVYQPNNTTTIINTRTAQAGVCAPRTNYVVFLDASAWLVAGDIQGDNVHPTVLGSAKYAWYIAQNMWTNRIPVKSTSFNTQAGQIWPHTTNGIVTWTTIP